MTAREFAHAVAAEKMAALNSYFDPQSQAAVAERLRALTVNGQQLMQVREILDLALTDICYTLLLALDGEASLGGIQQQFHIEDENGNVLTGGELEGAAWEEFFGT